MDAESPDLVILGSSSVHNKVLLQYYSWLMKGSASAIVPSLLGYPPRPRHRDSCPHNAPSPLLWIMSSGLHRRLCPEICAMSVWILVAILCIFLPLFGTILVQNSHSLFCAHSLAVMPDFVHVCNFFVRKSTMSHSEAFAYFAFYRDRLWAPVWTVPTVQCPVWANNRFIKVLLYPRPRQHTD